MDACRRQDCGHPGQSHQHYRGGTDCALCECPDYKGPRISRGRRLLAAFGFSLAAAAVTSCALYLLFTGYTGPGLVWLGVGALSLVWAGSAVADRGRP